MKKYFPVYVRVPLLFAVFFIAIEWIVGSKDGKPAFIEYPIVLILLGLFLFALIAVEIVASATNKILDRLATPEEKAAQLAKENMSFRDLPWVQKLMQKLTRTTRMDQEDELMLDHDYDGIKELDNDLPPWWVGLFYVTFIFGVVYMFRYHVFEGDNQHQEFEKEMAMAKIQVDEYKKNAPDMLTADAAKYLDSAADLAIGKQLYDTNCAVCHKPDGGGSIGPNLTDDHWILGGGVKNIFHTISEGGRPGKGMVPWKNNFKPTEIEKITSYVISLNGSNPADAKAAEGDIVWTKADLVVGDEDASEEVVESSEEVIEIIEE